MTKRISISKEMHADAAKNGKASAVDTVSTAAEAAAAYAVTPAHEGVPAHEGKEAPAIHHADAHVAADNAHAVADADAPAAGAEEPVIELTMATPDEAVAAGGADGAAVQDDTAATTTTADDTGEHHSNGAYYAGAAALAAGVVGAVLISNDDPADDADSSPPVPPPPPPPPANEAPTVDETQDLTTNEDTTLPFTVDASDDSDDAGDLTFAVADDDQPEHGTVTGGENGSFIYMPDADYNGDDSFVVTVTDSDGDSSQQTVNVTVNSVNDSPVLSDDAYTVYAEEAPEPGTMVYTAKATDPEGDTITYSLTGEGADSFSIDEDTGVVTFTDEDPDQGQYQATVVATDEHGASDSLVLTIDINEPPMFEMDTATATVDENVAAGTTVYTAMATDPDLNDTVTYSLSGDDAAAFAIDGTTGEITTVGDINYEMQDSYDVTVTATDSTGMTDTQALTIDVNDVNEAPTFAEDTATAHVDNDAAAGTVVYDANATNPEGGDVTYSLSGDDAASFTLDADDGELHIISSPDFAEQDSYDVTITATDAEGLHSAQSVTIEVDNPEMANLDTDSDGDTDMAQTFDASTAQFTYSEDANTANTVEINNFSDDDHIVVSNAESGDYSFAADDSDLVISFTNDDDAVSTITITDVVNTGDDAPMITDQASAEENLGYDFFQYA